MLTPLAAAMAAIPIVALTPIFNTMFASTSSTPRRLVVAIYVFFPIFVNTLAGAAADRPGARGADAQLCGVAVDDDEVWRVPGALPFFFTGLKIASSGAVIAAIVSEYFGGLQKGLGPAITSAAAASAYPRAWAIVTAAIGLGLVFYLAAVLAERLAMPWQRPQGELREAGSYIERRLGGRAGVVRAGGAGACGTTTRQGLERGRRVLVSR